MGPGGLCGEGLTSSWKRDMEQELEGRHSELELGCVVGGARGLPGGRAWEIRSWGARLGDWSVERVKSSQHPGVPPLPAGHSIRRPPLGR